MSTTPESTQEHPRRNRTYDADAMRTAWLKGFVWGFLGGFALFCVLVMEASR